MCYTGCYHADKKHGRCDKPGVNTVWTGFGEVNYVCNDHVSLYKKAEYAKCSRCASAGIHDGFVDGFMVNSGPYPAAKSKRRKPTKRKKK